MVFGSIAAQFAKPNEKFMYGAVREGGRARDNTISYISISSMKKIQSVPFGSIFFILLHNTKFTYIKKEGDAHEYS